MNYKERIEKILNTTITFELCRDAHMNTSFSPDKRAEQEQEYFRDSIETAIKDIEPIVNESNIELYDKLIEEFITGYEKRFIAMLTSRARCFSVMITGGGNIDTRKHKKANDAFQKKDDDLVSFYNWKIEKIKKALAPAPKSTEEQLKEAEDNHKIMVELNKLQRDKKLTREEKINIASTITNSRKMLEDFLWNLDNKSKFFTSSSNAKIKRLKSKLEREELFSKTENKTKVFDGFKVVTNFKENRYQIIFDDIPSEDVRTKLKSLGFKWSRKATAWQKHLTDGASSVRLFIEFYEGLVPAP